MQLALDIDARKLVKAINLLPREEKILIAESIEQDLLSEWDNYEESSEVKNRVKESYEAYKNGDYVKLKDLL
jgi:hypothetical protein